MYHHERAASEHPSAISSSPHLTYPSMDVTMPIEGAPPSYEQCVDGEVQHTTGAAVTRYEIPPPPYDQCVNGEVQPTTGAAMSRYEFLPPPPPYEQCVDGKVRLPSYDELRLLLTAIIEVLNHDKVNLGTDIEFLIAVAAAFILPGVGFLLVLCCNSTVASRSGAFAGFGLSLSLWVLIARFSIGPESILSVLWLVILSVILGLLICLRAILQYVHAKRISRRRPFPSPSSNSL